MNKLFFMMSLAALVLAPLGARAQNTPAMIGAGPHGYDFLIGKWTCTNSMPSHLHDRRHDQLLGSLASGSRRRLENHR